MCKVVFCQNSGEREALKIEVRDDNIYNVAMEKKLKVRELKPVSGNKVGRIKKNGIITEPHEDSTFVFLAQFGFDIELIKPTNIRKAKNPDILISGVIWEIKSPESNNKKTLKKRMHIASLQSDRIIFDLRRIKEKYCAEMEKNVLQKFKEKTTFKRLLLITHEGRLLDITK